MSKSDGPITIGRCGDCRFWLDYGLEFGGCSASRLTDALVRCGSTLEMVETKANFGCVLWEAKESS